MEKKQDLLAPQEHGLESAPDQENGVVALYRRLRTMILNGHFLPGSMLSQVKLAEALGVSRIPLREALRMLQNEGLIEAQHNQRARVPAFESSVVDSLYASRILLETLGLRLTMPHLTPQDRQELVSILTELDEVAVHIDLDAWEEPHRRFHRLLIAHAEDLLQQRIASYADQCEYYRRLYYRLVKMHHPVRPAEIIAAEHHAIAEACLQGQADLAASLLARHYARTALTVLGQMAPEFEPKAVRVALQIIGADSPLASTPPSRRQTHKAQTVQAHVGPDQEG